MTFPLNEMYSYSRLCDRLRSSAIIWKQVSLRSSAIYDPRSSAIRDRLRSFAIIWKPAFRLAKYGVPAQEISLIFFTCSSMFRAEKTANYLEILLIGQFSKALKSRKQTFHRGNAKEMPMRCQVRPSYP